jgi:hypothetical protein
MKERRLPKNVALQQRCQAKRVRARDGSSDEELGVAAGEQRFALSWAFDVPACRRSRIASIAHLHPGDLGRGTTARYHDAARQVIGNER